MSVIGELGFRLKPQPKTQQEPPTIEHAREVVAERDRLIGLGEKADADSRKWGTRLNETRSAAEALAEGRVLPEHLDETRAIAAAYQEAHANRSRGPTIRRQCEARRFELEVQEADAFSLWANLYVAEYIAKRDAMLPALREMMEAWDEAVAAFDSFRKARIEIARDPNSDVRRLNDASHCPAPPVDREVLEALMSVLPRPKL
jgi:hypothetical protein